MAPKKSQANFWDEIGIKDPKLKKIPENLRKIPNFNSFVNFLGKSSEKKTNFRVEITYKLNLSNPKLNKEIFVNDVIKVKEIIELLSAMYSKNPEENYKIITQIVKTDSIIMKFAHKFGGILKEDGEANVIYGGRDLAFIFDKKDMALNFLREMHSHPNGLSKEKIKIMAIGFYGIDKKKNNYDKKIIFTWVYKKNKWVRKKLL